MTLESQKLTTLSRVLRNATAIGFSAIALSMLAASAQANLVFNGSFESTSSGPGQFDNNTIATDWTSTGYNFIFAPGTGDTTGSDGQDGTVSLWGTNNGGVDVLPASSPDGGNYVAADGAFLVGAIQQTISGLTVGESYVVGFWWAGAQQSNRTGATTEQWQVSLGSEEQSTAIVDDVNHGFTGWVYQTFTFTADNTSDVLSFLAVGTPNGEPPFTLLDGVTMDAAPETGTLILMLAGLGLMGALGLRRSKNRQKNEFPAGRA